MSTDRRCGAAAEPATSREFVLTLTFPVGAPRHGWLAKSSACGGAETVVDQDHRYSATRATEKVIE